MKVVNIGERSGNYDSMVLNEGKAANNFGKMFYLDEKIYLVLKAVTDYKVWKSEKGGGGDGSSQLAFTLSDALKDELRSIASASKRLQPNLDFKNLDDDRKIYIKMSKTIGAAAAVEPDTELQLSIQIYAIFHQNSSGKSFIQMQIHELKSRKISLLNNNDTALDAMNYMPNSSSWF